MFRKDSTSNESDGYARIAELGTPMMIRFTALFALLLLSASGAGAQKLANSGLVVTGSVHKVEAKCFEGKPVIAVSLSFQIRNDNVTPVILFGGWSISTVKFTFVSTKPGSSSETTVAAKVVEYNPNLENPFGPATKDDFDPDYDWVWKPEEREAPEPIHAGGYRER